MKKSISFLGVLILAIMAMHIVPDTAHAQKARTIMLAGYKMKPRVATSGSGVVKVKLEKDTLTVYGEFSDLTNRYSGAYIMVETRDGGGNQLFALTAELNNDQTGGSLKAKNNRFELSAAEKQLLKDGELYITVNTFDHRNGEIRGNIAPMGE